MRVIEFDLESHFVVVLLTTLIEFDSKKKNSSIQSNVDFPIRRQKEEVRSHDVVFETAIARSFSVGFGPQGKIIFSSISYLTLPIDSFSATAK
jgi:hypothetical protein